MTQKIKNGSYVVSDNGLPERVDYIDELLQNAIIRLNARRGEFYPDKSFGSRLSGMRSHNAMLALAYARQAVDGLDGVYVKGCRSDNGAFLFTLILNDEERLVQIPYASI